MPQYLVCNYLPDDFDPSTVTEAMIEEIHALNREMIAAGVRKFACGISPAANAKTVRKQSDGIGGRGNPAGELPHAGSDQFAVERVDLFDHCFSDGRRVEVVGKVVGDEILWHDFSPCSSE